MITVGSMVSSMNGFLQLQRSQQSLFDASSKLTSGKRINSAKDDPAGLAIANLMTSQIRSNNQSIRNANDGISFTQVADGALSGANDILQRVRELAVQAGNGTLSANNRGTIQNEIDQLSNQLSDIGKNTKFNGINVFGSGSSTTALNIQVGFNQSISLELGNLSSSALSGGINSSSGDLDSGRVDAATSGVAAGSVSINGVALGAIAASTSGQADVKAGVINQASGQTGVSATASNVIQGGSVNAYQPVSQGISVTVAGNTTTLGSSANLNDFVKDFNLNVTGAEAQIDSNGKLQIYNNTGKDITLADNSVGGLGSLGLSAGSYSGSISLSSASGKNIDITTTALGSVDDLKAFGFNKQQGASSLSGGQVSGQTISASDGITINGTALGNVNSSGTNTNANDISSAINAISNKTGVTASANSELILSADVTALTTNSGLTINGVNVFSSFTGSTLNDAINQINSSGLGDINASSNSGGELVLSSKSGQDINIDNGASAFSQNGSAIANTVTQRGELSLTAKNGGEVNISSTAAIGSQTSALNKLGLSDVGGFSSNTSANVATTSNAGDLIKNIDNIMGQINKTRSGLGATQSRFLSTINNLAQSSIQSESSRSRIENADYAKSISEFLQARFSQQASSSIFVKRQESERAFISQLISG